MEQIDTIEKNENNSDRINIGKKKRDKAEKRERQVCSINTKSASTYFASRLLLLVRLLLLIIVIVLIVLVIILVLVLILSIGIGIGLGILFIFVLKTCNDRIELTVPSFGRR